MSDIPRYSVGRGYVIDANDNGPLVKYADHIAALLTQDQQHMEQQAAAVAAAEQRVREDAWESRKPWGEVRYGQGVQAAWDAVAALMPDTADEGVVLEALAAIDALTGDQP